MEGGINADELLNYLVKALLPNEASGTHCLKGLSALHSRLILWQELVSLRQCGSQFTAFTPPLFCEFGHSTEPLSLGPF